MTYTQNIVVPSASSVMPVASYNPLGIFAFLGGMWLFFLLLIAWVIVWKGLALWKAARSGSKGWFVALLLINTLGILEILYIYVFSKGNSKSVEPHNHS